jgi:hypothetical protein
MTIHIVASWWLIPMAVTIAAFVWALWTSSYDRGGYAEGLVTAFSLLVASIVSLVAWLIWALLT